jgi:hypothetical protein
MRNFGKYYLLKGLLITVFTTLSFVAVAQLGDPGEDPDAPIDGGVSLLLAAGVGYGIKKARDQRKKAKSNPIQSI